MRIHSIWSFVFFAVWVRGDGPTCGEPPTIELASVTSVTSPVSPVGTTVSYACQFGYVIDSTSRTSTCELTKDGDSAEWSDPGVSCIPRSCGHPGFVSNGRLLGSLFTFPNSVSYECIEGFLLRGGNSKRYCQASGSWSGRLPSCEAISCDPPKNPENGRVSYISLEFGAVLKYECDTGYSLQDKTPVHCTSEGTWSETDVACVESTCGFPPKPDHGSVEVIGSDGRPMAGTIAVYSCDEGRVASGPTSSKCLPIGQWTFPTPECLEECKIPQVPNGRIGRWVSQRYSSSQKYQEIPVGERVEDGEKLFLRCEEGYRPLGDSSNWQAMIKCKAGKWSADPFCELATCSSEPPETNNGRVDKMDIKPGGTVSYECLPDFMKVKYGNVACHLGEWKGKTPICKDTRCYSSGIKYLDGVSEISDVTKSGDELNVRCFEGYEPTRNLPQCSNGEWTRNKESPCNEKDCTVPHIAYGIIEERILGQERFNWKKFKWERSVSFEEVRVGSVPSRRAVLVLVCQEKYSLQGTGVYRTEIMCSTGRWSPNPVCLRTGTKQRITTEPSRDIKIIGSIDKISSATTNSPSLRTTDKSVPSTMVNVNDSLHMGSTSTTTLSSIRTTLKSIPVEYPGVPKEKNEANNDEIYFPVDSQELEDACSCEYVADENIVAHVEGKKVKSYDKVKNGTLLKLRCEKVGYHRLLGHQEILCKDCQPWKSSDFPTCLNPERGDTFIIYEDVNVSLDGVLEARKGKPLQLICIAMETAKFPKWRFPNVTGIHIKEKRRERTGDLVYISQLDIENFTSAYDGSYECAVEKELPTTLQIRVINPDGKCTDFPLDDEVLTVEYDGADTRVGTRATFSCRKSGQKLDGTSVATCLQTEEWSSPPPECIDIMCSEMKETNLMKISYTDNQRIGSYANFHCFAPGNRVGVARTLCLENGEWKDPEPTCQTPPCTSSSLYNVMPQGVEPDRDSLMNSMPYNTTVKLLCQDDDKSLAGNPFATCGSDGKWKIGDIQCISGCIPLRKPPGSELVIKPEKDVYRMGESVIFSCLPGLSLNVQKEKAMCLQPGWSEDVLPDCV